MLTIETYQLIFISLTSKLNFCDINLSYALLRINPIVSLYGDCNAKKVIRTGHRIGQLQSLCFCANRVHCHPGRTCCFACTNLHWSACRCTRRFKSFWQIHKCIDSQRKNRFLWRTFSWPPYWRIFTLQWTTSARSLWYQENGRWHILGPHRQRLWREGQLSWCRPLFVPLPHRLGRWKNRALAHRLSSWSRQKSTVQSGAWGHCKTLPDRFWFRSRGLSNHWRKILDRRRVWPLFNPRRHGRQDWSRLWNHGRWQARDVAWSL